MTPNGAPILRYTLDLAKPIYTRLGKAVEFICDDKHPSKPLSFKVEGRVRSYSRQGAYSFGEEHILDLFNEENLPLHQQQLPLF